MGQTEVGMVPPIRIERTTRGLGKLLYDPTLVLLKLLQTNPINGLNQTQIWLR